MSCSSCMPINPCGCEKKKQSCDDCPVVDWVPNTACTIGVTVNGCTDTLELRPGIQNCETKTVFGQNSKTGCLEYQNELYVATDGQEGYIMSVCPIDIAKFINLEDLANVEDEQPENCSLLVYKAENDCGPGCTGISDSWVHWYASEHLTDGLHWVAGFNENGCLEALDVPPRTDEYWWGMYRPSDTGNGVEFGYIQPEEVDTLPVNEDGLPLVLSQDANGKPLVGPLLASMCGRTEMWVTRPYSGETGYWENMTQDATDEIYIVKPNDSNWRAPCCGVLFVNYCINVKGAKGRFEIDVANYSSFNPGWTQAKENENSTHSCWYGSNGSGHGVSESATAFRKLEKGETMILGAHVYTAGTPDPDPDGDGSNIAHQYRIHAIKAVFIPLENA